MDKNFFPYLYSRSNVPDMIDGYCAPILKGSNPLLKMKAKRLLKYWGLLTDKAFFDKRIQRVFYTLYTEIDKVFPDLTYELSGRIKALISTLNKLDEIEEHIINELKVDFICKRFELNKNNIESNDGFVTSKLQELDASDNNELKNEFSEFFMNVNFGDQNPFDRVRDFFAFRIIIEDSGNGDCIEELYQVANLMIDFFNKNTFEVMRSDPRIQTGKLDIDSELIFIPEKSKIKPEYYDLVKDYVVCPKKDGYQSIHFVVYDPYTDRYFEVQIRTRSMDMIAETLANHDVYKQQRYGKQIQEVEETIDYSKINVKGFRYFKYIDPLTGEEKAYISDRAGITQAIPIKLEFEHFLTIT